VLAFPQALGLYKVITNLAVLGYDEETKRMMVESIHPGCTLEDVKQNTGFELIIKDIQTTLPPTEEELRILREEVDPLKLVIGREAK